MKAAAAVPIGRFQAGKTAWKIVDGNSAHHYHEHAEQIRAWRSARGFQVHVADGALSGPAAASVTPRVSSVGVKGLSTMLLTPVCVARLMTSRVPWAVIMTTRRPGRSAHAFWMNSRPFSSGIL